MKFKCVACGKVLSNPYDVDPLNGNIIMRPWYTDQNGLNHSAIACLECGTIHDTSGSIWRFLLSVFINRFMKVHSTIHPMNETILKDYHGKYPTVARKKYLHDMGISKDIVDALASRKIISHLSE